MHERLDVTPISVRKGLTLRISLEASDTLLANKTDLDPMAWTVARPCLGALKPLPSVWERLSFERAGQRELRLALRQRTRRRVFGDPGSRAAACCCST
jgi:hypothetical protein